MDHRNARQEEFLSKAKEAEGQAVLSRDQTVRESWLRIAEAYGALAHQAGKSL
jgi:hypothetical protein